MFSLPPLYKHQQELIELNPKKHLLAWSPGTSKTRTVIVLAQENKTDAIVIVPKSLVFNFEKEIDKWADGSVKFRIITKETFKRDWNILPKYDCLIIDEAHYQAGMTGFRKKSGMLKSVLSYNKKHNPTYRYLATATPYMSTPYNIYALANILGHSINYRKFTDMFFDSMRLPGMRYPITKVKKGIEPQIADLVKKIGNAVAMEDIFDVPEQTFMEEYFEQTSAQRAVVRSLEDTVPIAYWTKCHQIMGGTLKGDEYTDGQTFKSEKLVRVLELAHEHKKIAIICRYNYEIKVIAEKLKKKNVYIVNGHVPDEEKKRIVKMVEIDKECIIIINAACSEGIELPSIPIMVFYSYDFSLKNYIQMIGRILRSNRLKKNVYISLIVKNSVDEDVYKCIQKKTDFDCEIYNKNR